MSTTLTPEEYQAEVRALREQRAQLRGESTVVELVPTQRPKRLSLSEIVEQLLARGSGDRSSVTLSRNAKGETQIEVVVRTADNGAITTVAAAQAEAVRVYDDLRAAYPLATGLTGAEGGGAEKPAEAQ